MNIGEILRSFLAKKPEWGTGALYGDSRSIVEKAYGDVPFREVVGKANPVQWEERTPEEWRTFPVRNQGKGNTCMANARAKEMGVLTMLRDGEFIRFSAAHIYQRRANKSWPDNTGMFLSDVMAIGSKGVTLEDLVPSDLRTDKEVDEIKIEKHEERVGEIFSTSDTPIYIPGGDFETCASVIQTTGKAIVSMHYFLENEWNRRMPTIRDYSLGVTESRALRHGIALVDAFKHNGVPVILAEDSAHFGGFSQRLLTKEWFSKRNYGNAYSMQFKFDEGVGKKPVFDGSIISAQKCLRYEGFFPVNVDFVENAGPITIEALKKFQKKYGISANGNLGPVTRGMLEKLYGA